MLNVKEKSVACNFCGEKHSAHSDRASAADVRAALKLIGWDVAVPIVGFHSPALTKEEFYKKYPTLKRVTVDRCPKCANESIRKIPAAVFEGRATVYPNGLPFELRSLLNNK